MRSSTIIALFSSLAVGARASTLDARAPTARTLDTRVTADVCAFLDVDLQVPNLLGILGAIGHIDVCLCLSAVVDFAKSNPVTILASALVGVDAVVDILDGLITQHAADAKCTYPEHSTPICVGSDPCGFSCGDGFTPSPAKNPTTCVCAAPNTVCNGVCSTKTCPTQAPYSKREKRWAGSGACNSRGGGWMACGVYGGAARAWECLDTDKDLESCGGCDIPLTPYTPRGTDCTALPGVSDVSCRSGACAVERCAQGWTRAADGSHCMRDGEESLNRVHVPALQVDFWKK